MNPINKLILGSTFAVVSAALVYTVAVNQPVPDPTPRGCTQEKYEQLPPIQVPEACSTQWVYTCSGFGEWIQQCVNGEVDIQLLSDHFVDLQRQLRKASSTYDWTQNGI